MINASTAFGKMVAGHSHNVEVSVSIDVPGTEADMTAALVSASVDAQTITDVAAGTRIPVGYPAVSADITLSGPLGANGLDTVVWFNPYHPKSPLYRQRVLGSPVVIRYGLHPDGSSGVAELITKFTGYVDSYSVNPLAGTVSFTCIDQRTKLRNAVNLPAVITSMPYNSGLTAEYVLDQVLRAASGQKISTWYPVRPNAQFAAGLRGSVWPDVGQVNVASGPSPVPVFAPGAYGTALADLANPAGSKSDPLTLVWSVDPTRSGGTIGDSFFAEALIYWDGSTGGESIDLQFGRATSYFSVGFIGGPGGGLAFTAGNAALSTSARVVWPMPLSPGPHYLAVAVYWPSGSATCSVTPVLDDVAGTPISLANTRASMFSTVLLTRPAARVSNGSWAAVVLTPDLGVPAPSYSGYIPTATMDPSLNHLVAMPATSGDGWQVIQELADAEQAVAGFDPETGDFRFRNRLTLRSGDSVRDVSSYTSLIDLQITVDSANFANRVQVPWTGYAFATAYSSIYTIATLVRVPRNSSITVSPSLAAGLAVDVQTAVALASNGQVLVGSEGGATAAAGTVGRSMYRACIDSGGLTAHPGISITVFQPSADAVVLTLTNRTSQDAYLVSPASYADVPAGTPCLILAGRAVTPADAQTVDVQFPPVNPDGSGGAVSSSDGEVLYQVPGNVWLQDGGTAQQLAIDTLSDLSGQRPNLTGVAIVPDPRLQLMDRVKLIDVDSDIEVYATIWSQTLALSVSSEAVEYTHTIDVRGLAGPGNWLLGIPGRTEVGLTTNT